MVMRVESVFETVDVLEYRCNLGCVVLMCRCICGMCSTEIKGICSPIMSFNRTAQPSQRFHAFVLELPAYRTTHYRGSSFFKHTARLCNNQYQQWSFPLMSPFTRQTFTKTTPSPHFSLPITFHETKEICKMYMYSVKIFWK